MGPRGLLLARRLPAPLPCPKPLQDGRYRWQVDLVTPMAMQFCYEGVIDETFVTDLRRVRIPRSALDLGKEEGREDPGGTVTLAMISGSSQARQADRLRRVTPCPRRSDAPLTRPGPTVQLYRDLRDMSWPQVGPFLGRRMKNYVAESRGKPRSIAHAIASPDPKNVHEHTPYTMHHTPHHTPHHMLPAVGQRRKSMSSREIFPR